MVAITVSQQSVGTVRLSMMLYVLYIVFRVLFISGVRDSKLIRGNLNSRYMMLSYVNYIHAHISREC